MRATQSEQPPRATRRDWIALAALMLPVLLIAVDNTVLAFALPEISIALTPTGTQLLWIVDSYPLVLAGLLISMGSFADRIGRRKLLLIGGTGFALISGLAAFAPSPELLIAARVGLGFFGAMLMPSTLSLIRNIFLDPTQRRIAIAAWAAGFSGGNALGPIVGGLLLAHFWWGSVFLLAVPILLPLLVLGPIFIRESKDPHPAPIDAASILLSFAGMVPIVYAIKSLATQGFGPTTLLAATFGAFFLSLFIRRQLTRSQAMLDVRLFTNPVFTGGVITNLLSLFSMTGFLYFISQHLQLVVGLSATQAGLVLIPGAVLGMISGLCAAPLAARVQPRWLVVGGLLLCASGFFLVTTLNPPPPVFLVSAFVLIGVGVGMAETIANDLILTAAPAHRAGAASAISETAFETGAVLGTAILGTILTGVYRTEINVPPDLRPEQVTQAKGTLGGALQVASDLPEAAGRALRESAIRAFDDGALLTCTVGALTMLCAAIIAGVLLRRTQASRRVQSH